MDFASEAMSRDLPAVSRPADEQVFRVPDLSIVTRKDSGERIKRPRTSDKGQTSAACRGETSTSQVCKDLLSILTSSRLGSQKDLQPLAILVQHPLPPTLAMSANFYQLYQKACMSLFTVEQLELIRRLKMTGIEATAVAEAFKTLDEIEHELMSAKTNSDALFAFMQTAALEKPPSPLHATTSASPDSFAATPIQQPPVRAASRIGHAAQSLPAAGSPMAPCSSTSPDRPISLQTTPLPSTTASSPSFSQESTRPIRSLRTPMKEITTLDDPSELDDFMVQGEEGCISDMKAFITQYSLRQTTVATMTGVSQPYISKLLNGNHRELSQRCRRNIYCWYLNCRRHPEKLAAFLADPANRLETNGDGELVPQRRERYVFRPILIRMLEQFFAQTPFPDLNRRIEIANACNQALQMDKKGMVLMPKEVVSPQVVANWFANKRKELRRRSNEQAQQNGYCLQTNSVNTTPTSSEPFSLIGIAQQMSQSTDSPMDYAFQNRSSSDDSSPSPNPDENSADAEILTPPALSSTSMDLAAIANRIALQQPAGLLPPEPSPINFNQLASQLLGTFHFNVGAGACFRPAPFKADSDPAATSASSLPLAGVGLPLQLPAVSTTEIIQQLYQQHPLASQLLKMERVE